MAHFWHPESLLAFRQCHPGIAIPSAFHSRLSHDVIVALGIMNTWEQLSNVFNERKIMKPQLSRFGAKLCKNTGILQLMDDLGRAMSSPGATYMLGGGNPASIPAMQEIWRLEMQRLAASPEQFGPLVSNYDPPQGRPQFIKSLADYLNQLYGWSLSEKNIGLTNGSQTAFFLLFNMLAGTTGDGQKKKIFLPLSPEYIGYADQCVEPDSFCSNRPRIEILDKHTFKYCVDFDNFSIGDEVSAIAASRPTNPSGNVLTASEVNKLQAIAKDKGLYLMLDQAYGNPFPGIIFCDANPVFDENTIMSFSLSKLGLPACRTGIIVASEEIITLLSAANAVISLANGNIGPELMTPLLTNHKIHEICRTEVTPFYRNRATQAITWLSEFMDDSLPYYLHTCEGSLFLWLWCKDLPITSQELYTRLKARRVLVVPGEYFFFGLTEPWKHTSECLRLNYSQSPEVVREGLRIIAEEIKKAY